MKKAPRKITLASEKTDPSLEGLPLASFQRRMWALAIDILLVVLITIPLFVIISVVTIKVKHPRLFYLYTAIQAEQEKERKSELLDDFVFETIYIIHDKMPEYLSACDILVSPQSFSIGNSFHQSPIKLFEYMAVGRAVVASRIGQISSLIEDGRNGLLFAPDDAQDLEAALKKLTQNPLLRKRLGQNARSDVKEKYTWEANVRRILQALESRT